MSSPPPERDKKMSATGIRLLALAAVLAIVGFAIAIPLEGTAAGIGVALISLASVPGVAGIALIASSVVSRRSRAGKPFA